MVKCMPDIANFNEMYLSALINAARENPHAAASLFKADLSVIAELLRLPSQAIKSISRSPIFITLPTLHIEDLSRKPSSDCPEHITNLNFNYLATTRHVSAKNVRLGMLISKLPKEVCEELIMMSMRELNDVARSGSLLFTCAVSGRTLQRVKASIAKENQDREFVRHIPMLSMAVAI